MCVRARACAHAHTHTHTHVHTHTHTHTYAQTDRHAKHAHTHTHTHHTQGRGACARARGHIIVWRYLLLRLALGDLCGGLFFALRFCACFRRVLCCEGYVNLYVYICKCMCVYIHSPSSLSHTHVTLSLSYAPLCRTHFSLSRKHLPRDSLSLSHTSLLIAACSWSRARQCTHASSLYSIRSQSC